MNEGNGSAPAERHGGTFEQGLANGQKLLSRHPAAALEQAQVLLRPGPEPRAMRLAAAACRRLGRPDDAERAELAAIKAGLKIAQLNDAAIAGAEDRTAEAELLLERFLSDQPDDLLALTMAAEVDLAALRTEHAGRRLQRVLGRAPSFLRAAMLMTKVLVLQARIRDAIDLLEGIVSRKPNNRIALEELAQLYAEANDHDRAAETYRRILESHWDDGSLWTVYAQHLRILGRAEDSQSAFRRALEIDLGNGAAWWGLTNYFPFVVSEADRETMEQALNDNRDSPRDGGPLHIALAIVADEDGDYARAFEHLAAGKQLRLKGNPYDPDALTADVDALIRTFTPSFFTARRTGGVSDRAPIFLLGMPRSGSTLVERILGRHSEVEAAGELPIMPRLIKRLRNEGGGSFAKRLETMTAGELTKLGQWYVERSRDYRTTDKPRFVDKLNVNWLHSGLIRAMLPNARIIDLRRDPLDCCWSNFKLLFADGHRASNDLRHIARFYRDYDRLLSAVDAAAPGAILTVQYEDVVEDVADQARRMLDFLGLDFEPGCIVPHLAEGAVATPSSEQVRRAINRESIGSAAPYRRWLGPMIDELGKLAPDR